MMVQLRCLRILIGTEKIFYFNIFVLILLRDINFTNIFLSVFMSVYPNSGLKFMQVFIPSL